MDKASVLVVHFLNIKDAVEQLVCPEQNVDQKDANVMSSVSTSNHERHYKQSDSFSRGDK